MVLALVSRLVYACSPLYKHSLYKASEQVRPPTHSARLLSQKHNPPQLTRLQQASPRATMLARAIREGLTLFGPLAIFLVPATYLFIHHTGARNEEIKPGSGEVINA
jgi:hypothetical protein